MPIPDYQTVMLPLLKLTAQHDALTMNEAVKLIADEFELTHAQRKELLPSGKQTIILSRVGWARTYLKKAGLLISPQRGSIAITKRGEEVLATNPQLINVEYLHQFPEFLDFYEASYQDVKQTKVDTVHETPEEILEESYLQLKNQILSDLLEKIKACSWQFFEDLIVDTVVKMGYGGSRKDAGRAVGKSGDEGIDGIINEDRLGLDVIYLQAKKWQDNNTVGRPEIQKFVGALHGKRARKGIFITTSDFTADARDYVKTIDVKVVLISGKQLVELMWEHNVGLNSAAIYEIKKLDFDYFSE